MSENKRQKKGGANPKKASANAGPRSAIKNNNNNNDFQAQSRTEAAKIKNELLRANKKISTLTQKGGTMSVKDGTVNVSMSKNRVNSLIDCILNPENADRVLPIECDDKAICQYVGAALDMQLDNGLVGSTSFKSFIALTGNPECPLATSEYEGRSWTTPANQFFTITSRSEASGGEAFSVCGTMWVGTGTDIITLQLPTETKAQSDYVYNQKTIEAKDIILYSFPFGAKQVSFSSLNGEDGTMLFYNNAGTQVGVANFDSNSDGAFISVAATATYYAIITSGTIDTEVKVTSQVNNTYNIDGLYNLKPVLSSTYLAVEDVERYHRVVSSSVCLTYAPDLQFGGGNLLSALCDTTSMDNFQSWENYLYTRRRSYLNRALTGGYNLFISNPKTLKFKNANRYNSFASDGGSLALTMVTYDPSNAAILKQLNMQVKGHVWYEFNTDDRSRNAKRYMAQNVVCERILSGLAALCRPSENRTHKDVLRLIGKAWHWFNGGSDEATALRHALSTAGKGALKALPGAIAMLA